jgi:hypothetical protein
MMGMQSHEFEKFWKRVSLFSDDELFGFRNKYWKYPQGSVEFDVGTVSDNELYTRQEFSEHRKDVNERIKHWTEVARTVNVNIGCGLSWLDVRDILQMVAEYSEYPNKFKLADKETNGLFGSEFIEHIYKTNKKLIKESRNEKK